MPQGSTSRAACSPTRPRLNPYWTFAATHGRPYVTWKLATTLDGRSAAADGSSRWITSPESRADVHRLRSTVDAVMVGTGTVLADDPELTVREGGVPVAPDRQPLRVVLGSRPLPPGARVLDASGPTLAGAMVAAGLVDRVVAYIAPVLLGAGPAALGDAGITTITQALRLEPDVDEPVTRFGPDVRIIARVVRAEEV